MYKLHLRRTSCVEPPHYPHKDPILGLDLFLQYTRAFRSHTFLDFSTHIFVTHGKTFKCNVLGTPTFRTADPQVSKAVFATHASSFGLYPIAKHIWGNGIIVVDGERWNHGRALMWGSFEVVHLRNFERLERHVDVFMGLLPQEGETVDLMPLFQRLILDTSSEFIFVEAMGALQNSTFSTKFTDAFTYAQKGTANRAMLKRFKFLYRDEKWWAACKLITDYADEHVEKALQRLRDRKESDKGQLRLVDEASNPTLMAQDTQDKYTLRCHIISVFSPAHDGAAITLLNALVHLSRHPTVWRNLKSEILPTQLEPLNYELLNSCKYLTHVLKETHRLTPIVTLNQRHCLTTATLPTGGGPTRTTPLLIPRGSNIDINYRAMMRDPDFWGPDANVFVLERWDTIRPGWEYTPFGGGPRSCPGRRLVFTECAYMLVRLLRAFGGSECRDGVGEWREEMRMTFQGRNGCLVGLVR
ncbi:cytochrome P450 [Ophiobolus disseminans]|uniref:Cytochrome P450 n=1 Tax=Ophiobolus disseminans TaxID=1469910 RepID=A0A6A7A020_9PLEO|nr:cytochrome P450 [Ophiobolus disseminans]